jgi:hypothetical protein
MNQSSIPVEVSHNEVSREKTLGGAIGLCIKAAGYEPKQVLDGVRVDGRPLDKAQWSRWESGAEGVVWPKFRALMDFCGNDAPLLWMLHDRQYDLGSVRKLESETERENRTLREENAALRRVLMGGGKP